MSLPRKIILVGLVLVVAACSRDRDITLTRFKNTGDGPDEFSIVPNKPLQEPESYSALPPPAPGASNRTDLDPKADSIAALGGNPRAARQASIAPGNAGLVRYAARYGADPAIRQELAAEDEKIRRNYGRRNILRIGPRDNYTDAYKKEWLDSYAEAERLRRAGVITPTAPPPPSR